MLVIVPLDANSDPICQRFVRIPLGPAVTGRFGLTGLLPVTMRPIARHSAGFDSSPGPNHPLTIRARDASHHRSLSLTAPLLLFR